MAEEIVGDRVEAEENEDEAEDGDRGGRESVASAHGDQGPILRDKSWSVNVLGVFRFCVGWAKSLDGTTLAPLKVLNAVPGPPFSAPLELACLMALDGHDIKRGHGEGLQRPCGDQPEMSVRRGQPQASDGPRLRGWVSFSSFNLPGVLGRRSREGRESQAFLDRSREQSLSPCPPITVLEGRSIPSKPPARTKRKRSRSRQEPDPRFSGRTGKRTDKKLE